MRFLILVLVLFGLACSKSEPQTPPSDSEPSEAPATPSQAEPAADEGATVKAPTIELLDAGAEPHSSLRQALEAGAKDTMNIRSEVTMAGMMGVQGKQTTVIPPVIHTLALEVRSVEPSGTATIGFEVVDSKAVSAPEAPANVQDKLKESTASIRGLRGTYRVDPQGMVTDVEIAAPAGSESRDPHMAASIGEFLYRSSVPVPKQPVGTGGRWVVKRGLEEGGISFDETSTYRVQKIDGRSIAVSVQTERIAPKQKVGSPDPFDLQTFTATGSGQLEVELDRIAPKVASRKTQTELFMNRPGPSGSGIQSQLSISAKERMTRPE